MIRHRDMMSNLLLSVQTRYSTLYRVYSIIYITLQIQITQIKYDQYVNGDVFLSVRIEL